MPTPARTPTRSRRRRALLAGLAAVVALPALVGPTAGAAGTQEPSAADARARRDEIRRQQTELAAQLEPIKATDAELAKALATIDANVRAQEARVSDANRAADDAHRQVTELTERRRDTEDRIADLERRVRERAVSSYVHPAGRVDEGALVLQGDDLSSAERKRALVEAVTGEGQDVRDQLRLAREELTRLQAEAQAASEEADARRAEAADALAELATAREAQRKVKAAYEARIKGYEEEAAKLTAEDGQMQKIILDAEARAAAQAEADRKANAVLSGQSAESGGGPPPDAPGSVSRPARAGGCIWPIDGTVSQEFRAGGHPGIDIFAPHGVPIYAAMPGTVIFAGWNNGGYGNLVLVDHGGDTVTAYAHLSQVIAGVGQNVGQGQLVGLEGTTGHSTGPHLHFEVRIGGKATNPRACLP